MPREVFICSAVFTGDNDPRFTILEDGQYYVITKHLLATMKAGATAAELELEPEKITEGDW